MTKLKNKRKKYFHIDENTSSNEVFAILSEVESNDESEIDNIINDSDTAQHNPTKRRIESPLYLCQKQMFMLLVSNQSDQMTVKYLKFSIQSLKFMFQMRLMDPLLSVPVRASTSINMMLMQKKKCVIKQTFLKRRNRPEKISDGGKEFVRYFKASQ